MFGLSNPFKGRTGAAGGVGRAIGVPGGGSAGNDSLMQQLLQRSGATPMPGSAIGYGAPIGGGGMSTGGPSMPTNIPLNAPPTDGSYFNPGIGAGQSQFDYTNQLNREQGLPNMSQTEFDQAHKPGGSLFNGGVKYHGPRLDSTTAFDHATTPPAAQRFETGQKMMDGYANGWQPNPILMRILDGMKGEPAEPIPQNLAGNMWDRNAPQ